MGNGMATLVRATAIADAYGSAFYGSVAGVVAACATGARAVAPVVAAGAYVAFGGYEPLLWLLFAGSILAAVAARRADRLLAAGGEAAAGPGSSPQGTDGGEGANEETNKRPNSGPTCW
jgi:hypothetical protein